MHMHALAMQSLEGNLQQVHGQLQTKLIIYQGACVHDCMYFKFE